MLDRTGTKAALERSTTKSPLTDADVEGLLGSVARVLIARGRSVREQTPDETTPDDLKGPSGKYRAPMLVAADALVVGFGADLMEELLN